MAGDWIARCKGLSKKPEILLISRLTGKNRREVADIMSEFWEWVDGETADGLIPGLTVNDLSNVIDDTDEKFWLAVVQAGWLKITDQAIEIPNFKRWLGKSAKQRLQKNIRQSKWRSPGEKDASVDGKSSTDASTREPNRTEPRKKCSTNTSSADEKPPNSETATTNSDQTGQESPPTKNSDDTPGTNGRKARPRDLLFDAIAEVTASDPNASGSHIGRVKKHLLEAEPPYTPEEVYRWAEMLKEEGWMEGYPSLNFLDQAIGRVRAKPLQKKKGKSNGHSKAGLRGVFQGQADEVPGDAQTVEQLGYDIDF